MPTVEVAVAGTTFEGRQTVLSDAYEMQQSGRYPITAELIRQPDNQHDPNAIAVQLTVDWNGIPYPPRPIGFVPRILAAQLAPRMDAGETFPVRGVRIIAGEQNGTTTYGVRLDVENIKEGITK